jgi:Protein of unknown function (DUF3175)
MAGQAKSRAKKSVSRKKSARKKTAGRTSQRRRDGGRARVASPRKWSQRVTRTSDALDLEGGVFKLRSPQKIAASLKQSAEHSKRRKAEPYRSALSMLTFYINRAGKTLPASRRKVLEKAKEELRAQFGRA